MSDKLERLKKLRVLALRGVDGEKEQAQAMLDKLIKKYSISLDDISDEKLNEYTFEYHGKEQKRLLSQIIYKVTNDQFAVRSLEYTKSGRTCKTRLGGKCTSGQKVEIEFLFDFYKRLFEKERETLFQAFVQKHRLFGELKDGEEAKEISPEERRKMFAFMSGLSNETPQTQIAEKSGG